MASIFLSYSHEDRKRAEGIAQSLQSAGHEVWWDKHLRAGSRFSKDINEALKKSDLVAAQALQHDPDLVFGREVPAGRPADVLHHLLGRPFGA